MKNNKNVNQGQKNKGNIFDAYKCVTFFWRLIVVKINMYIAITNSKIYIWENLKHHNFIHFISQLSMVVVNGGVIIGLVALLATTDKAS